MTRAYLDHASTVPLRPVAAQATVRALEELCADPGRMHAEALAARVALERAREQVAGLFGARSREVVFTSGATESIATATWGGAERARAKGRVDEAGQVHQVLSAVEHSAVRLSAGRAGAVTIVGVDRHGRVDPAEVVAAVRPHTAVVHLQLANHEVGTIQPVAEVVEQLRGSEVLVHVDAAQAAGRVLLSFAELGADLVSASGHKLGGPAGTGVLLVRRGLRLPALLVGGDQERARRAGLEPVPALVGLGAAAEELAATGTAEAEAAAGLCDRIRAIAAQIDGVQVYGDPLHRLPHLVCLGIDGVEPQAVLLGLDRAGIAAHSGSSCASESLEPSPVLEAMGADAHRSLRLSVGWSTTDADIDRLESALAPTIRDLRALSNPPPMRQS